MAGSRSRLVILIILGFLIPAPVAAADQRLADEINRTNVWVNTSQFTPPVYQVNPCCDTAAYQDTRVWQDWSCCHFSWVEQQWLRVPISGGMRASDGTDREAVILDRRDQPMDYEFWQFRYDQSQWRWEANWGTGAPPSMFTPGKGGVRVCPAGTCVQGSGIAFLPGLIRVKDLQAGVINHSLGLVVPNACRKIVGPAMKSDGTDTSGCITYGTRFKLPPGYDCSQFPGYVLRLVCAMAASPDPDLVIMPTDQSHNGFAFRAENWKRYRAPWAPYDKLVNPYDDLAGMNLFHCPSTACYQDKTHQMAGVERVFADLYPLP